MEESVGQSRREQPLRPGCSAACVVLPCLASVSSHQCMASQVIHIMTPFVQLVMKSCCLATFHTDCDNNDKQTGLTCQRETERALIPVTPVGQYQSSVIHLNCLDCKLSVWRKPFLTPVFCLE